MAEFEIRVATAVYPDRIELELQCGREDLVANVTKQIMDLTDESIRRALIELGWTPPGEKDD